MSNKPARRPPTYVPAVKHTRPGEAKGGLLHSLGMIGSILGISLALAWVTLLLW